MKKRSFNLTIIFMLIILGVFYFEFKKNHWLSVFSFSSSSQSSSSTHSSHSPLFNTKKVLFNQQQTSASLSQPLKNSKSSLPVKTPAQTQVTNNQLQSALDELKRIQDCYQNRNCNFKNTDPRSYEIGVGQKLAAQLKYIRTQFQDEPSALSYFESLGQTYILNYDGYVTEEALNLLSLTPPSGENLKAITQGLVDTPNPKIISQALNEFKRYINTPWENQVHSFLIHTLTNGATFTARATAQGILPLINDHSINNYRQALSHMTPQSAVAKILSSAIKEYDRLKAGA